MLLGANTAEPCVSKGHGSLCSPSPGELPGARQLWAAGHHVGKGMSISRMKGGSVVAPP